jgi:hypothetical protein
MQYDLEKINQERRRQGKAALSQAQAQRASQDATPGCDLNTVLIAAVATSILSSSDSAHASTPSTPSFVSGGGDFGGGGGSSDGGGISGSD